jgi:3-oxoadipate enol-lactonase
MLKTIVNDFELAYDRRGQGVPLVLIHGYPLDHTIWNPVLPYLDNDFDLILPDLRGFGQSGSIPAQYALTDMAADLAALLEHLKIEKAVIAGHSMGGYIALAFARAYPRHILGLGLVASQPFADTPEKKAARRQESEHVLTHGVGDVAEGMFTKLTAEPNLQTKLRRLMLQQQPEGVAGALLAMADRDDSNELLPSFDFPVAIIHGLVDKIIPIERARDMKALVKNGSLVSIEDAGHMPMMEAPQITAEALLTLL